MDPEKISDSSWARQSVPQDESFKTEKTLIQTVNMIGASRSPTPYKVKTPKEQYVLCGADILLNAVGHDLEGEATCVICGRSTRVTVAEGEISKLEPVSAVLHVVEIRSPGQNAQIVCEGSPLFDKEECLQSWLKTYKGLPGRVYSLQEYMDRASELISERVGPARSEPEKYSISKILRVMRCADCDCSPAECSDSKSAMDCPSCRLESCCCWVAPAAAS